MKINIKDIQILITKNQICCKSVNPKHILPQKNYLYRSNPSRHTTHRNKIREISPEKEP